MVAALESSGPAELVKLAHFFEFTAANEGVRRLGASTADDVGRLPELPPPYTPALLQRDAMFAAANLSHSQRWGYGCTYVHTQRLAWRCPYPPTNFGGMRCPVLAISD